MAPPFLALTFLYCCCLVVGSYPQPDSSLLLFFEHVNRIGYSLSPLGFGVLLMEYEQRGLLIHEIAFFKGLEGTVDKY